MNYLKIKLLQFAYRQPENLKEFLIERLENQKKLKD